MGRERSCRHSSFDPPCVLVMVADGASVEEGCGVLVVMMAKVEGGVGGRMGRVG